MAKRGIIESDVDFIGSQEPLTSAEENALSEFFKKKKELKKQKSLRIRRTTKKGFITVLLT